MRMHVAGDGPGAGDPRLTRALDSLAARYDLVLVEGHKTTPLTKVWLLSPGEAAPPPEAGEVLATLPGGEERAGAFEAILDEWLPRAWLAAPVFGCVLVGGASARMGRPKHLIAAEDGRTWLERTVDVLRGAAAEVVIAGAGEVPPSLAACARLPDAPDAEGPMAGLLAALRWSPRAGVLACACDLPDLSAEALDWLLAQRAPGRWAVQPRLEGAPNVEPLLAYYDFRARPLLEALAREGNFRPGAIAPDARVFTPTPPAALSGAWRNVNEP
jgi:molybdopterin-guanine dinucleotide biosynthesis protein A